MTEETQPRKHRRARLWTVLAAVAALLAVLIIPPMVSVSRYKSEITHLISASLGRPVRLSSVEVRLLPSPGFVLSDLYVDEDPAWGVEPILHANSVTASIRLLSLWRGKLEIGKISVDEASLNLVHNPGDHWNVDSLFRQAGVKNSARLRLPYLVATNSRINIRNGLEKLPFSLTDANISFWQENPGEWRIRLRAQPVRTDLNLQSEDTGTLHLEGSMRSAPELRQMPLHLYVEWRDAQMGQLSRLIAGDDSGWRGNLRGEFHLDGTAESAQIKARLRALGVHRAEFAPAQSMDFDALCEYRYSLIDRSVEKLSCDSPLGNGHVRISGDLPSTSQPNLTPNLTFALDRVPMAAGLDALRTVRSDFAPGIAAKGSISGKITWTKPADAPEAQPIAAPHSATGKHSRPQPTPGPLTGSLSIDDFQLSGGSLSAPLLFPRLTLQPAPGEVTLTTSTALPAGAPSPLALTAKFSRAGYELAIHGQASVARAQELAHVTGGQHASMLNNLAGDPLALDIEAQGPWRPMENLQPTVPFATDTINGTITLHNANWKSDYLANRVMISQATLHLSPGHIDWSPVLFSYGPVKGTAAISLPDNCTQQNVCTPHFDVQFAQLDASALQAAILGAQAKVTLISTLLERLHPAAAPVWPQLEGTVKAETLTLGPLSMRSASAQVRITEAGVQLSDLDATMLGGHLHGNGALTPPASAKDKPAYSFDGSLDKLSPSAVGVLLDQHWSGGVFAAHGKVTLGGFTEADLAASAKGALHFDWQHGSVAGAGSDLNRFDHWNADAEIANGSIHLKQNELKHGSRSTAAEASATLGHGAKATFAKAVSSKQ